MLATIKRYGTGKCLINGTEGEGVEVEFADGAIRGFLSMKEFARLLKTRADNRANSKSEAPLFEREQR
jgi:hypothetical protein